MPGKILSIERVVTFLTPFFAAGATAFTGWVAHIGVHMRPDDVAGVEIAAFLGTVAIVAKWLHGRQIPAIAGIEPPSPADLDKLHAEIEDYLKNHAAQTAVDEEALVEAVLTRISAGLIRRPSPGAGGSPATPVA